MYRKERRINVRIGLHKRHRGSLYSEQLEPRLLLTTLQADSLGEPAYDQEIQASAYYAAVSPNGIEGDGQTSIIYDAGTGGTYKLTFSLKGGNTVESFVTVN